MAFQKTTSSTLGRWLADASLLACILVLPALGWALAGRPLSPLLTFPPPLNPPTGYLAFSWWAFAAVVVALGMLLWPWLHSSRRNAGATRERPSPPRTSAHRATLPLWGWIALVWIVGWWMIAWTRFPHAASIQPYTFFPLWLGFIVVVNALTESRGRIPLLRRTPVRWILLFGLSAAFWCIFEWLNRFVQNWHYLGVADFGPAAYAVHATICFSTVLPAVAAVAEWLSTFPAWENRLAHGPSYRWLEHPNAGAALIALGATALVLTGMYPTTCYPALWVAPLALFLGREIAMRRSTIGPQLARGDWRNAGSWMAAALICGFFWELWNWHSLAKWIYTVPGVERWRVFEMPLLGYTGYLPFGLECLVISNRVLTHSAPAREPENTIL